MASFAALSSSRNARLSKSVAPSLGTQKQPAAQEIKPTILPSTPPPPSPSSVVESTPPSSRSSSSGITSSSSQSALHASLPPEVEIRTGPDRGRGVWTKKRKLTPAPPPQLDEDGAIVVQSSTRRPVYTAGKWIPPILRALVSLLDFVLFSSGSTVFSIQPHSAALSTSSLSSCCSNCLLSPPEIALQRSRSAASTSTTIDVKLSRCAACRVARFCSRVRPSPLPSFSP